MGIKLSIDDFGTGYSSLSYLTKFPINVLKIDKNFIENTISDPFADKLVISIIGLAKDLGLEVIAEGVETQRQFDFLVKKGCDYIQGFLISKPLPVKMLEDKFLKQYMVN